MTKDDKLFSIFIKTFNCIKNDPNFWHKKTVKIFLKFFEKNQKFLIPPKEFFLIKNLHDFMLYLVIAVAITIMKDLSIH